MSGKKKAKSYDREFIREAVNLVNNGSRSAAEIANDLGVPGTTLYGWVAKFKSGKWTRDGKPTSKTPKADSVESRRYSELEKQVRLLKMERDILKKAMAYCVDVPK